MVGTKCAERAEGWRWSVLGAALFLDATDRVDKRGCAAEVHGILGKRTPRRGGERAYHQTPSELDGVRRNETFPLGTTYLKVVENIITLKCFKLVRVCVDIWYPY